MRQFYGKADGDDPEAPDPTPKVPELDAMPVDEKNKRKRRMKEQLREQHKEKVSRQKQKRLDKYIEHQLRREEREILMQKLQETQIDSSLLKSAKLLGTGRETKREKLTKAMNLERAGKATDETRDLLYEKREVKKWDDAADEEEFKSTDAVSTFYDPSQHGGFGFNNLVKVKKVKKKGYSWRARVEAEEARLNKDEDEMDFESESDEGEDEDEEDEEDDEDDDDEEDDEDDEESSSLHSSKAKDFKSWAENQVKKMEGNVELVNTPAPANYKPTIHQEDLDDGIREDYVPLKSNLHREIFTVEVDRPPKIQEARMNLPVFGEEYRIMEAIHHNDCIILCGETGSGKTTQVPQFLYESGYGSAGSETSGMIGITQPRRVAAVSMANRVATEMGDHGNRVGYQIRFDGNVKKETAMKFMTDGVLLREMMSDFMLTKYSAIIIDEAHERSINTDILIGMLSRVLKLRRQYHQKDPSKYHPLKLIIMSATLRVTDFSENKALFKVAPPVLKVDARQYPVSIHFNRRTAFNYTEEAFRKTCKIHQRLPKGAILVFLTGKSEINDLVKRLRKEFPFKKHIQEDEVPDVQVDPKNADVEVEEIEFDVNEETQVDDYDVAEEEADEEGFEETLEDDQTSQDPLYVLPLYSLLPTKEQMKVFESPPKGSRLCVVATNVAETSLTIPGVRYVVDGGRAKERRYNEENGVQSFEVSWISKASADQRSGRAGRTGPGHTYRLYSSALFESDFPQFAPPEILRMPVESVVLSMKSMGIDNIVNFPFPTAPTKTSLRKAEKLLRYLDAIDDDQRVTDFGRQMSLLPLSPRFAKIVLIGNQLDCLPYIIALVSGLSVGDPFLGEYDLGLQVNEIDGDQSQLELEKKRQLRAKFSKSRAMFSSLDQSSDCLKLLSAICSSDHVKPAKRDQFYQNNFLRSKTMLEIGKLRKQLMYIARVSISEDSVASSHEVSLKLGKPSKKQVQAIKQMVAAGFIDCVAIRADLVSDEVTLTNSMSIVSVPYRPVLPATDDFAYIHPSSVLCQNGQVPPNYLVYQLLQSSQSGKLRLKCLCDIKPKSLANVGKRSGLISYSKPLGHPYAPKNISSTQRECYVVPRFGANIGTGAVGIDLPAIKVKQTKVKGVWKVD